MVEKPDGDQAKQKDEVWPFVALYCIMLLSIVITLNNDDPISFDYSPAIIVGSLFLIGIVVYFAVARLKGHALFGFGDRSFLQNIGWHIFVLTGIIFLSHLFFGALICILIIWFHVPVFDVSCKLPSERDLSLLVWDDMARGAFKFFAKYLGLAAPACPPNPNSDATSAIETSIKLFTSLVLVWFALSLAKSWYGRLRGP